MKLSEESISSIPPHILINHPAVVIGIDVVKVNGIPFLGTISIVMKLGSATELISTKVGPIVKVLLVIIKTNNTMEARTVSAITLRSTANKQGSFYYYSLVT